MAASWRSTAAPDVRMIVAVAGGPPRRDAVDQLAPVGEHDAAALRARDRERRPRGLHLRIGQPDVAEPGLVPVVPIHETAIIGQTCPRSTISPRHKLAALERAHLRRALVPTDRLRRPLGRAQRPPAAVVLLQRLPRLEPPSGAQGRGHRRDRALRRRRRRLAAGHRQSPALRRAGGAARPAQGHARRPACSAPAISPMPGSCRRWSGATISS